MSKLGRNNVVRVGLVVALIAVMGQPAVVTANDALGLGNIIGGVTGQVGQLSTNLMGPMGVGGILNQATGLVGGMTRPVIGMLGSMTGGGSGPLGMLGTLTGGQTGPMGIMQNPTNSMSLTSGVLGGLTSGAQAAANIGTSSQAEAAAAGIAAAHMAEQQHSLSTGGLAPYGGASLIRNNFKREAIPSGLMANEAAAAAHVASNAAATAATAEGLYGGHLGGVHGAASEMVAAGAGAAAAAGAANAMGALGAHEAFGMGPAGLAAGAYGSADMAAGMNAASLGVQAAAAHEAASGAGAVPFGMVGPYGLGGLNHLSSPANIAGAAAQSLASGHLAANAAAAGATGAIVAGNVAHAANVGAAAAAAAANVANAASAENALVGVNQVANHVVGRQALAADALGNAQAEAAIAGADMAAHGANNARSASLAGNAYRQAKLASARDRVNIAGTIQNSARISDAAIATHDAATKAEDSLLGSELAVDSAATVLDSDAAYIPPVTNSLLRSLPYGRLGVRNIVPKPLTYPSVLLPDVWLNGAPVNYMNVPLRMLPYGIGSTLGTNQLWQNGAALANGGLINGQPFVASNGRYLNGMVIDPAYAYMAAHHVYGAAGSSILPILANGQVEAHDEVALANMVNNQQLNGAGMSATYQGYGRMNPVPMISGSVNDVNLMPTTTIGTTYPIGSALVIEPRDSYFQDYVDNASSRQNFDERQQ